MNLLANESAYDLWARDYPPVPHNPLMRAEQQAMLELLPHVAGCRALDLACGSGRYALLLEQRGAREVIGADRSHAMLARAPLALRVRTDMSSLPFRPASFDLVVSGLAVGHAPDLVAWCEEAARVLKPGGWLVYSDFHADAARAGMTRSFTDAGRRKHVLLHSAWTMDQHREAGRCVGLVEAGLREVRVGQELVEHFKGSEDFYARWQELALVVALAWRKPEGALA